MSINSADKKPEKYIGPDGKTKIRMVPVDREVVKSEGGMKRIATNKSDKNADPKDKGLKTFKKLRASYESFKPHMMYDPETGKSYEAKVKADHIRMKKMGYTHDKPEVKEVSEAEDPKMYCKNCGDEFGKPKSESCMYDAYNAEGKNWIKKESVNEKYKVGDTVKPTKGPHAGHPHEVIHDYGDGHYNIAPVGLAPSSIKYGLGAAKAHKKDLRKESVDEVLDTPGAMDRYHNKAKAQSDRARNSATAKIVRGNKDISKEKDVIRRREKGMDMATNVRAKQFRKAVTGKPYGEAVKEDMNPYLKHSANKLKDKHASFSRQLGDLQTKKLKGAKNPSIDQEIAKYQQKLRHVKNAMKSEATIPDGQTAMTKKPEPSKKDQKTINKIQDLMKRANEARND